MASKSKQNKPSDRGHKENTPVSKDVASTNPKSRGNNPRNRVVNFDWSQDDSDVKISFPIGKKLGEQDVDAEFTNTSATVKFKDGRKWHCKFYSEIVKEISRVKISKRQLIIQVGKKEQGVAWPSLEYIAGKPAEKKMASKLETQEAAEQTRQEQNVDTQKPSTETQKPPASTQKPSVNTQKPLVSAQKPSGSTQEPSTNTQKASFSTQEQSVSTKEQSLNTQESSVDTPTVTPAPSKENGAEETSTSDENKITEEKEEEEPPYSLSIIKHDWYEKAAEVLVVHVYVKQLKKDDLKVTFEEKELTVLFKTSDSKFLGLHQGTTEDTTFKWTITLHDELTPTTCKYRVTSACIELTLRKKIPKRWGVLEALQHKDPVDNQSEPPKPNTWLPVGPSTANKENEKPKDNEKMSKVIFDELSNEKPSVTDLEDAQPIRDTVKETKDYVTQKPTCMVSPLNKDAEGQVVPPGMTGLDNLGNTCFMNSVLQVLANTRELRDFFLEGLFQKEINPENPLGTGGKLAVAFAVLMRVLWSGKHRSYAPSKLKNLVAMKASQFTGFAQHDAQEFMAFLLDGLHEDVNRIKKKPYTQTVDSDGRPDEVVADEAWMVHKKRNDSFIVDLFQGQYKSKLVCPMCGKVSITFDPFMILPVPLPKKKRPLPVIFMSHDPYRKPLRIMLQLPKDAVTEQLKEAVAQKTGVSTKNMKVFEAYKNKILKFFSKGESLANVSSSDRIIVSEVMSEEMAGEPVIELAVLQRTMLPYQVPTRCTFCRRDARPGEKLKRCTKCFRAAYCDHQCQRHDWQQKHRTMCKFSAEPVGCPFIISLPQSQATFTRLVQMAEAYARYSVDVFQPPVTQEQKSPAPPATVSTPGDKTESETKAELRRSSTASSTLTSSSSVASELSTESSFVSTSSEQDLFTKASSPDEASTSESSSADSSTLKEVSSREQSGDSEGSLSPSLSPGVSTEDITQESCLMNKDKIDVNKPSGSQRHAETNMTLECKETLSSPEIGDINTQKAPPTRYVMGRPHDLVEGQTPNFNLRPCDKDGKVYSGERGATLDNKGEEAIDLSCNYYLAMDWRNKDKLKSYVLVQSKDLEYDDDPSMHTVNLEETNFTVDQCLSLFTEPEVLSPEHAWYCPDCKEHREATKQLSIWRLPHTLIIQLKRFSFRNLIWRDKIDKMVDFPVRGLDLSNYYMGTRPSTEPPPVYDLYGVVNHHGGLLGGHYTAFGRCPQLADSKQNEVGWRLFDDSIVSYTSEKQVVTRSAYVLFYRRRNCNMPLFDNKALYTDEEDQVESSPGKKLTDEIITQDKGCIMAGGDTVDLTSRNAAGFFVGSDDGATDMDAVD